MFKAFSNLSIGKKVTLGFSVCLLIMVFSVATTVVYVKKTDNLSRLLMKVRMPTAQNTSVMLNGVNHSLAALRGWMILGKNKFKDQRKAVWIDLEHSIKKMGRLSKNWTNPKNIEAAKLLKNDLLEFKQYQKEIEDISHSIDNTPATKILTLEAAPLANIMLESITNLINLELKLSGGAKRKKILGLMADVRGTTARSVANIRAFLLTGDKAFEKQFNIMWSKNIKRFNELSKYAAGFNDRKKIEFKKFDRAHKKFMPFPEKMFRIRNSDGWNIAHKWLDSKAAPVASRIVKNLEMMLDNQNQLMVHDGAKINKLIASLINIEYIILFTGALITFLIGYLILKSIEKVLSSVTQQLVTGMKKVTGLSDAINSSSQELSSSSEQQSSSMQETSSTMHEIEAMVNRNMNEAKKSNEVASKSYSEVNSGSNKIKQMIEIISKIQGSNEEIADQVDKGNKQMGEISTIIKTIGEKTQVINDIVFQTKLLSFNASVEAARAGEHGKGFAVVAEEVGNLAQMSGDASIQIYEMLESSISSVEAVTKNQRKDMEKLIEKSKQNILEGIDLGGESEAILASILSNMELLKNSIDEITIASEEQSNGVGEISKAILEVNEATRVNSNISTETSNISSELNESIHGLNLVLSALSSSNKVEPADLDKEDPALKKSA